MSLLLGVADIVGKPIANMLLQKQRGANAVVTVAHTGAEDLTRYTKFADILIAAIGKPEANTWGDAERWRGCYRCRYQPC